MPELWVQIRRKRKQGMKWEIGGRVICVCVFLRDSKGKEDLATER